MQTIIEPMILHSAEAFLDFPRFGIQIPAMDSRKTRILESLKNQPDCKNCLDNWLINGFDDELTLEDLCRIHSPEYAKGFFDSRLNDRLKAAYELVNPDGSPNRWNRESAISPLENMRPRLLKSMTGAFRASCIALDKEFCHFLGGGTHHGHRDFGHGFCAFNDAALAVAKLRDQGRIKKAWIIDTDAHKGDGTSALFADVPEVTTLSIHMARGWPLDGSLAQNHPSYIPSDIDIPIESGEEHQYLERLEQGLETLSRGSGADLAIVLAGVDPWEKDGLPSSSLLNLNRKQLFQRDRMVYEFLQKQGMPSAWLTSGGYGEDAWQIHFEFLSWVITRRLKG